MVVKRQAGEKSENLLSTMDLTILKILNESKEDIGILQLSFIISIGNRGINRHLTRLYKHGLISKTPTGKNKKVILKPTENGKVILKIYKR